MEKWVCTVCGYEYDPEIETLIRVLRRVPLLKIFLMTGFAPIVAYLRTCLKKHN